MNCFGNLFKSRKKEKPESDGHKFIKYGVLVSELRHHMLTYLYSVTLLSYSQCSKFCNLEVRKFNTKAPKLLMLTEKDDGGILVEFSYSKVYEQERERWTYPDCIEKKFLFSTFEETMEKAEEYVLDLYRYVKKGKTEELRIKLPTWPKKIMQTISFLDIGKMFVHIQNSMLDDFVEFAKNSTTCVKSLSLLQINEPNRIQSKIKQVFNTAFFQQLTELYISLNLEINIDDFLCFKAPKTTVLLKHCQISDDAIRQKVAQINNRPEKQEILIIVPNYRTREFDLAVMFPGVNPEEQGLFSGSYVIGNVRISTSNRGKHLKIQKFTDVFMRLIRMVDGAVV